MTRTCDHDTKTWRPAVNEEGWRCVECDELVAVKLKSRNELTLQIGDVIRSRGPKARLYRVVSFAQPKPGVITVFLAPKNHAGAALVRSTAQLMNSRWSVIEPTTEPQQS